MLPPLEIVPQYSSPFEVFNVDVHFLLLLGCTEELIPGSEVHIGVSESLSLFHRVRFKLLGNFELMLGGFELSVQSPDVLPEILRLVSE